MAEGFLKVSHKELEALIRLAYKTKLSLFIWGPVGIGKSTTVRKVARDLAKEQNREFVEWNREHEKEKLFESPEKYFVLSDFRLSQCDPSDVKGIPVPRNDAVVWKIPEVFEYFTLSKASGIIFFDELNLAPPVIQASAYQIILDRCISEKPLSDKVLVIGAGNRLQDVKQVFQMSEALRNRFIHAELKVPSIEEWTEWASTHEIDPRITAFLNFRRSLLFREPKGDEYAFPTPRSWEFASKLLKNIEKNDFSMIEKAIASAVGPGTAVEFVAFIKKVSEVNIRPEDVLRNPEILRGRDIDILYAVIAEIANYFGTKKNAETFIKIISVSSWLRKNVEDSGTELSVLLLKLAKSVMPEDKFKKNILMKTPMGELEKIREIYKYLF